MKRIPKNQHPKYYPDYIKTINKKKEKPLSKHKKLQKKHDNALEAILKNPEIIGFEKNTFIAKEISLHEGTKRVGEVDLIICDCNNKTTYYCEYKCHDYETNKNKAISQLKKAKRLITDCYRNDHERLLYIHGNFDIEELTQKGFIPFKYTPVK